MSDTDENDAIVEQIAAFVAREMAETQRVIGEHNEAVARWTFERELPKWILRMGVLDWPEKPRKLAIIALVKAGWHCPAIAVQRSDGAARGYYVVREKGRVEFIAYCCNGCDVCNG